MFYNELLESDAEEVGYFDYLQKLCTANSLDIGVVDSSIGITPL